MSFLRGSWSQLLLLAIAMVLALSVWLRDDTPVKNAAANVLVWSGKAESVERVEWEGKQKVKLEAKADKLGRYFVGVLEKRVQILTPGPADAGAPQKPKDERIPFISVKAAEDLMHVLAPLRAFRSLGKYDPQRDEEFGFKEPEGTLRVTIGGKQQTLLVGGSTPGGGDRYAKHVESELVYAVPGDIVRNLSYADSRLLERELHAFEMKEIEQARVSARGGERQLVRVPGKEEGWANPDSPTTLDETAGNWMSKLHRLRPSEYVEAPPAGVGEANLVVRLEYFQRGRSRGFLELFKVPAGEKPEFFVRSEQTRWYAKVLASSAEQVEQDLASVIR